MLRLSPQSTNNASPPRGVAGSIVHTHAALPSLPLTRAGALGAGCQFSPCFWLMVHKTLGAVRISSDAAPPGVTRSEKVATTSPETGVEVATRSAEPAPAPVLPARRVGVGGGVGEKYCAVMVRMTACDVP